VVYVNRRLGDRGRYVLESVMTRFKQLKEHDRAVKSGTIDDLQKAIDYCQMRIRSATMKHHEKHWSKLLREAEQAMSKRFGTDGT
jgi:hypothetical protein